LNNRAGAAGGAIQWLNSPPALSEEYYTLIKNGMFNGNKAGVYGQNLAG
jgi:hypothetical protein